MPVVNPMTFYWMSLSSKLSDVLLIGCVLFLLCVTAALLIDWCSEYELLPKQQVKTIAVFGIAFIMAHILLPDKQTIEKMVIAQNVTYERVEQATDVVSNVYNDIMDLFKEDTSDE